jgi:hypothetical protein
VLPAGAAARAELIVRYLEGPQPLPGRETTMGFVVGAGAAEAAEVVSDRVGGMAIATTPIVARSRLCINMSLLKCLSGSLSRARAEHDRAPTPLEP